MELNEQAGKEFAQLEWDSRLDDDCRQIVRLAIREDLDRSYDLTTLCLVDPSQMGQAAIVARQPGVIAGMRAIEAALDEMEVRLQLTRLVEDGDSVAAGTAVARMCGVARDLLTSERLLLNLLGHLSGIATRTQRFVAAIQGTQAAIYDTRKTTPGWRRLEKFAVRCGGGRNHRTGLFDAVLIKDNHLAFTGASENPMGPADAVVRARQRLPQLLPADCDARTFIVEIEVDTLEQLDQVLTVAPDIVLLDNMTPSQLVEAVRRRDATNRHIQLEASGGIRLETVAEVAATGVDRISVGGLTHSAVSLDVGMDWERTADKHR